MILTPNALLMSENVALHSDRHLSAGHSISDLGDCMQHHHIHQPRSVAGYMLTVLDRSKQSVPSTTSVICQKETMNDRCPS